MWKGQRSGQSLLWSSAPKVWGPGSSGADWGGCRYWRARQTDRPERAMGKPGCSCGRSGSGCGVGEESRPPGPGRPRLVPRPSRSLGGRAGAWDAPLCSRLVLRSAGEAGRALGCLWVLLQKV